MVNPPNSQAPELWPNAQNAKPFVDRKPRKIVGPIHRDAPLVWRVATTYGFLLERRTDESYTEALIVPGKRDAAAFVIKELTEVPPEYAGRFNPDTELWLEFASGQTLAEIDWRLAQPTRPGVRFTVGHADGILKAVKHAPTIAASMNAALSKRGRSALVGIVDSDKPHRFERFLKPFGFESQQHGRLVLGRPFVFDHRHQQPDP